jgi:hypothetical protein
MPFTDIQIRNARYNLDGTGNRLSDGGGMYLQLDKSGGKYWRMNYRFVGKQKTLALGAYPAVSLAAARKKRDNAREKLAAGIDPGEAKKAEKRAVRIAAANSFEVVANSTRDELPAKPPSQFQQLTNSGVKRLTQRMIVYPLMQTR